MPAVITRPETGRRLAVRRPALSRPADPFDVVAFAIRAPAFLPVAGRFVTPDILGYRGGVVKFGTHAENMFLADLRTSNPADFTTARVRRPCAARLDIDLYGNKSGKLKSS